MVSHIVGNHRAFAALTDAGRVVCWGDAESGGDCSLTFPSNFEKAMLFIIKGSLVEYS